MKYLLDTNICSAHMRRSGALAHRLFQYYSSIAVPTVVIAELFSGDYQRNDPEALLAQIEDLVGEFTILSFDLASAKIFGQIKGTLRPRGISISASDLMIGSVAIAHNLTLVTHNTADFLQIPDLRLEEWLSP